MIAVVDESIDSSGAGSYTIGCVVVPDDEVGCLRDDLRLLEREKGGPLHWADDDDWLHDRILELIGTHAEAFITYRMQPAPTRQHERVRQESLTNLVGVLANRSPCELVIDRREPNADHRDLQTVRKAASAGRHSVTGRHSAYSAESLLALADAAAGTMRDERETCETCMSFLSDCFVLLNGEPPASRRRAVRVPGAPTRRSR